MPEERNDQTDKDALIDDYEEGATDLPERDAMSLIDPTSLLGGGLPLGATPGTTGTTTPTADPTATPVPPAGINLPKLPTLPANNPGGAYTPDASSTSNP